MLVLTNLDETVGHEQKGTRPCLIVAIPSINEKPSSNFGLAVIVPLTTKDKPWWTMVPIPHNETGLEKDSYAMCHQVRTVSFKRIKKTVGNIHEVDLTRVRMVLISMLSSGV